MYTGCYVGKVYIVNRGNSYFKQAKTQKQSHNNWSLQRRIFFLEMSFSRGKLRFTQSEQNTDKRTTRFFFEQL